MSLAQLEAALYYVPSKAEMRGWKDHVRERDANNWIRNKFLEPQRDCPSSFSVISSNPRRSLHSPFGACHARLQSPCWDTVALIEDHHRFSKLGHYKSWFSWFIMHSPFKGAFKPNQNINKILNGEYPLCFDVDADYNLVCTAAIGLRMFSEHIDIAMGWCNYTSKGANPIAALLLSEPGKWGSGWHKIFRFDLDFKSTARALLHGEWASPTKRSFKECSANGTPYKISRFIAKDAVNKEVSLSTVIQSVWDRFPNDKLVQAQEFMQLMEKA